MITKLEIEHHLFNLSFEDHVSTQNKVYSFCKKYLKRKRPSFKIVKILRYATSRNYKILL